MSPCKILMFAAGLAFAPGLASAMDQGFYVGLSAAAEDLDATFSKTTDNTHPSNGTPSKGRTFHNRDSDTKTSSGFGIVAGYQRPLHYGSLYWSGEVSLAWHSGKARGRLPWIKDASARTPGGASDPSWPQSGEGWPDVWSFEKDRSHGLSLRLGGQPDFLAAMLGEGSGLYVLAAVHRVKAEFNVYYEGCSGDAGCPAGKEDASYLRGTDKVDRDYTAWTFGAGVHTSVAEQMALQVEAYHTEYEKEVFGLLDSSQEPHVKIPQEPDARETGLRLRLLRYFQ